MTFRIAVANVSKLPLTSINVTGADDVYTRRRLRRLLTGSNIIGVDVNYTLATVVEDMGTSDPMVALNTVNGTLNTAIRDGSFVKALQVAAVATGNNFLASVYDNITVAVPLVEIGAIKVRNSNSPTPAPTPTSEKNNKGGNVVLIGVVVAAGTLVLGLVAYTGMRMSKEKDSKQNCIVPVEE